MRTDHSYFNCGNHLKQLYISNKTKLFSYKEGQGEVTCVGTVELFVAKIKMKSRDQHINLY